jgi:hypothetical protein
MKDDDIWARLQISLAALLGRPLPPHRLRSLLIPKALRNGASASQRAFKTAFGMSMACFTTHSACIHRRSRIDPARAAADAWQRLPIGRPCRSAQHSPATPFGSRMFFGASALPLPSCQLTTVVYCLAARFTRHRSRWIASTSRNGALAANSACRIAFGNSIAVRTLDSALKWPLKAN